MSTTMFLGYSNALWLRNDELPRDQVERINVVDKGGSHQDLLSAAGFATYFPVSWYSDNLEARAVTLAGEMVSRVGHPIVFAGRDLANATLEYIDGRSTPRPVALYELEITATGQITSIETLRDDFAPTGRADQIDGWGHHDLWIVAKGGDDVVSGSHGDDTIKAGAGHDRVAGENGDDRIFGGKGNDPLLQGDSGRDVIKGGSGHDRIEGGLDADRLFGGRGDDLIIGGSSTPGGRAARDRIFGGGGDDLLDMTGEARTVARGGAGADTFVFDRFNDGRDVVKDFQPDRDTLIFNTGANPFFLEDFIDIELNLKHRGGDTIIQTGHDSIRLQDLSVDFEDLTIRVMTATEYVEYLDEVF
ncbi:calcium-binding protein [Phaeobacter gallaeciensis]|uniref:calcium-binding protein n=1 Tax=Phaeobacter gallaeciensis TaxID=60890 RepID=UPI00237F7114|nr:calcium-binding protein [Phaeobacter gallaeciensis]MDE4305336.1 calcium-binding protein [Phaeobacter gallaeciensis]MDE4309684.1 calcium-binding protein [Phaeobacter gallaeciensis]MDE4313993.1 calcium-binding protein [Phaeobacter gallaeciensis]MDE4318613.1 calcium-binding protein [Phaeobacter gallaeciensis]MDE4322627.1 calcium-binding protein [Phaeobacter gallaeciensis]